MKLARLLFFSLIAACLNAQVVVSGSTGADGDFDPNINLPPNTITEQSGQCIHTINGLAVNCIITVHLQEPPNHIFNFRNILIRPGYTVKFKRNRANTPVILLATGDVTINGTIDVSGSDWNDTEDGTPFSPALGGPGGFSGGVGPAPGAPTTKDGPGLGPGGGGLLATDGSFATGFLPYGIPELQPLIGGSGGSGVTDAGGVFGGSGGGGALLIAASGTIDLGLGDIPAIQAKCGFGAAHQGSAGAIRLVATNLKGNRPLYTLGNINNPCPTGRIRLESAQLSQYTGSTTPSASVNHPLFDPPISVFPPITPTLQIMTIGGVALPAAPTADATTPDIALPPSNPINVVVQATHVPTLTPVQILIAPQFGSGPGSIVTGTLTGAVGQTKTATISITLPPSGAGNISAVIRTPFVPEP